jgi:hypothetical protein
MSQTAKWSGVKNSFCKFSNSQNHTQFHIVNQYHFSFSDHESFLVVSFSNEKDIQTPDAELLISCWDVDKYNKDLFLGQVIIPLKQLRPNETTKMWYPLQPRPGMNDKVKGKIQLEVHLHATDAVHHYI